MKRKTTIGKTIYYGAMIKSNHSLLISTVKQRIADHVGISAMNVARYMNSSSIYETDDYIIWSNVPVTYRRTGFAIRSKYN